MPDPLVIIGGSGALGHGLAVRLAKAGVPLTIGSRDAGRAAESAEKVKSEAGGGDVEGLENAEAATKADVVILCVPFANHAQTVKTLAESMREGQLLVDATVPLAAAVSGKPTRTLGVWQGSAAQQSQELVGDGVRVVSALHTVSGEMLADLDHELDEDVLVCGAKKDDKKRVIAILEQIDGLRGVDCGPLDQAKIIESLTALLIGINIRYKTHAGIRITGLPADG